MLARWARWTTWTALRMSNSIDYSRMGRALTGGRDPNVSHVSSKPVWAEGIISSWNSSLSMQVKPL